jgi:hypothetical protein
MIILTLPALFLIVLLMFRPVRFVVGWGIVALLCLAAYSCAHASEPDWRIVGKPPNLCTAVADVQDDFGTPIHTPQDIVDMFNATKGFKAEIDPRSNARMVIIQITPPSDDPDDLLMMILVDGYQACMKAAKED